jgi:diguanylate cyclase (GGDEF)-like protein/PAS domain S-box-containing protein
MPGSAYAARAENAFLRQRVDACEQTMKELREQLQNYHSLLDDNTDPVFLVDRHGRLQYVNQAFAGSAGKPASVLVGAYLEDVFPADEAEKYRSIAGKVINSNESKTLETRLEHPAGDRYFLATARAVRILPGAGQTMILFYKEITERIHREQELRRLSITDGLTRLYNRTFFDAELDRLKGSRYYPISIAMADVDNLKQVNDRLGHVAGDDLLRRAADLMRSTFRTEDVVARIGGDEFAVILPRTDSAAAQVAVDRLRQGLASQPPSGAPLSLSIGYSAAEKGHDLEEVLAQADLAMYAEKRTRRQPRPAAPAAPAAL